VEAIDCFFAFSGPHEFEPVNIAQQVVVEQLELEWLQRRVALF
jgi:hypothetical protein